MDQRTTDAQTPEDLSYLCSRQYEDYLDWLENQNRPAFDLFKPFRLLGGLAAGIAVMAGAIFLMS
jgi:hypothetical protein